MSKIQKHQETLNSDTPDHCRGLMTENYLSTNSAYPITYGTVIPVECAPEYTLQGSRVVTCLKGIVYSHLARPKCVDPGIQGSWIYQWNSNMVSDILWHTIQFESLISPIAKQRCIYFHEMCDFSLEIHLTKINVKFPWCRSPFIFT